MKPATSIVLIVDDEAELCELFSLALENAGFETLTASNGNDAFRIVNERRIDVVVSDVRMPGGDGIDLLEKIRSLPARTPAVILVTGFADLSADEARRRGAAAFLSKPIDFEVLVETVKKSLQTEAAGN